MRTAPIIFLILHATVFCYGQESALRLLNNKERLDYFKSSQFPGPRTVIKDSAGAVLKGFNLKFPVIGDDVFAATDFYVDTSGKIKEIVVRKASTADHELIKKIFDLEEEQLRGSMELTKADCKREREILADVLIKESENRKNDQVLDMEVDNQQEGLVMSILQQCGEPTLASVGTDGVRAVFIVLQHARRKNQEKYFPVLESFIKTGAIRKGSLAPIEDRLLVAAGNKQRYGTQIVFFARTGYHLFPIEDPEHVNDRRAAAGLSTLEQYLKEREEFYGAEIK